MTSLSGNLKNRNHNGGYSLMELVVVISIMVIAVGIAGLSVSVMFAKDAERWAKAIDDQLSEVRMAAMSKPGVYILKLNTVSTGEGNTIEIKRTSDPTLPATFAVADETRQIKVKERAYIMIGEEGAVPADPADGTYGTIEIWFNKANGSVSQISINGTPADLTKAYEIKCIAVRNKSKEKSIKIMPVTGRHFIE